MLKQFARACANLQKDDEIFRIVLMIAFLLFYFLANGRREKKKKLSV